jgi:hypothetical protein
MVDLSIVFCKRLPGRVHWVPTASWKLATSVQRIWNHDFFTPLMAIIPWNPAKQTGKQWKTPPRPLAWTMPAISSYIQLCQLCHTVKEWTARDLLTWKCEKKMTRHWPSCIHWYPLATGFFKAPTIPKNHLQRDRSPWTTLDPGGGQVADSHQCHWTDLGLSVVLSIAVFF